MKDLEALEPDFHNSLLWIRDNDPEPLDLTFTVEEVKGGREGGRERGKEERKKGGETRKGGEERRRGEREGGGGGGRRRSELQLVTFAHCPNTF